MNPVRSARTWLMLGLANYCRMRASRALDSWSATIREHPDDPYFADSFAGHCNEITRTAVVAWSELADSIDPRLNHRQEAS